MLGGVNVRLCRAHEDDDDLWQQSNQPTGSGLSGSAVTNSDCDSARGWLTTNTTYADGLGPVYANTPAGRLGKRAWARGVRTVDSYSAAGALSHRERLHEPPSLAICSPESPSPSGHHFG